jgi:hypothetical protein
MRLDRQLGQTDSEGAKEAGTGEMRRPSGTPDF